MTLRLQKYKLIIFDWDGTLVDSLESYKSWDKLYVKKFYGVDLTLEHLSDLAKEMKTVTPKGVDNKYFRYLDEEYGDGTTPIDVIWDNLYSLSTQIQARISYRNDAAKALRLFQRNTDAHLALATNAEMRDIVYFSSKESLTGPLVAPLEFFDIIVTGDVVANPKPHPETFERVIRQYDVKPSEVLIFEDSVHGMSAARATGADVVAIYADDTAKEHAHFVVDNWGEVVSALEEGVS